MRFPPGFRLDSCRNAQHASLAFTLIEVVIASGILFICLFAILGLLANVLRNARTLQNQTDAGVVLGSVAAKTYVQLINTNQIAGEGPVSVDLDDLERLYPDYSWDIPELTRIGTTNSLCTVDVNVRRRKDGEVLRLSFLIYAPHLRGTTPSGGLR
jgi:type II secretory pathway pseudopilin PulG